MVNAFLRTIHILTNVLKYAAGAVLFFGLMLLTTADVAGRYLFNSPITGAFELTELMLVLVVFFSLAHVQSEKCHVSVTFFADKMPYKIRRCLHILNRMLGLALCFLITWKSAERGFEAMAQSLHSGTLSIPVFWFMFAVSLGCAAMGLEILKDLAEKPLDLTGAPS